ncbi:MAG: hypothetical protein N3E36_02955 [Sulfolobales archaeon]|nr:hypothetical protein [Sulfolobales archaeon]
MNEACWNPLVKQWIIVTEHRSTRPWRQGKKQAMFKCPFCPSALELAYLEKWSIVSLLELGICLVEGSLLVKLLELDAYSVIEAHGTCRVVEETPEYKGDLCTLSLDRITKVIDLCRNEYIKLFSLSYVEYVDTLRDRGNEIGVLVMHLHSQIHALLLVSLRVKAELESIKEYYGVAGKSLLYSIVGCELKKLEKVIYENDYYVVIAPLYAMWPYEVHVYLKKHFTSIAEVISGALRYLTDALRIVTAMYTALLEAQELNKDASLS